MTAKMLFRMRLVVGVTVLVGLAAIAAKRFGAGFVGGLAIGVVLGIVAVFVGMMMFARSMRGSGEQGLAPAIPREVKPWDYQMSLQTLEGKPIDTTSFRGRLLFLNFWSTWCAPCVAELPSIERLARRFADSGQVTFACVTPEASEGVRTFLAKKGLTLPVYRIDGEPPAMFETRSIPATFVVSRTGEVVFQHIGAARWDSDEMIEFLNKAVT